MLYCVSGIKRTLPQHAVRAKGSSHRFTKSLNHYMLVGGGLAVNILRGRTHFMV